MGVYKNVSQKKCFFINLNNQESFRWKKKCTCLYIQKAKTIAKPLYIYKNPDNFQKSRQFALCFIQKAPDTLCYLIFHDFFGIGIYIYTNSMALCVTWRFSMQKFRHFEKSKTICVMFFIHKKSDICVTHFYGVFEIGRGKGGGCQTKKELCVKFL